jgi:hypothetical protein
MTGTTFSLSFFISGGLMMGHYRLNLFHRYISSFYQALHVFLCGISRGILFPFFLFVSIAHMRTA